VLGGFPLRNGPSWLNLWVICMLALIPPFLGLRLSVAWTIARLACPGRPRAVAMNVARSVAVLLVEVRVGMAMYRNKLR